MSRFEELAIEQNIDGLKSFADMTKVSRKLSILNGDTYLACEKDINLSIPSPYSIFFQFKCLEEACIMPSLMEVES